MEDHFSSSLDKLFHMIKSSIQVNHFCSLNDCTKHQDISFQIKCNNAENHPKLFCNSSSYQVVKYFVRSFNECFQVFDKPEWIIFVSFFERRKKTNSRCDYTPLLYYKGQLQKVTEIVSWTIGTVTDRTQFLDNFQIYQNETNMRE